RDLPAEHRRDRRGPHADAARAARGRRCHRQWAVDGRRDADRADPRLRAVRPGGDGRMQLSRIRIVAVLLGPLVAALVLAYLLSGARGGNDRVHVLAEFASADGVYAGSQVRIVGVEVGIVEEVEPAGGVARVHLSLDPGT